MKEKFSAPEQKLALGCGVLALALMIVLIALIPKAIYEDRYAMVHPEATPVFSRDNYSKLPWEFRWSDSYVIDRGFYDMRDWYTQNFDLRVQGAGAMNCQSLTNIEKRFIATRSVTVVLCETDEDLEISVIRSTYIR